MNAEAVCRLVSNSPGLRRAVKDALAPDKVTARGCGPRNIPTKADAVVTTGALSPAVERLAARLGTWQVFVLPEAVAALADFIGRLPAAQGDALPLLVGADTASVERLAKADLNVSAQQEVLL